MKILDIHTHDASRENAIINLSKEVTPQPGKLYSAGVHPWDTDTPDADKAIDRLEIEAASPFIVAIGEAGLDRLHGADLDRQMQFLRLQARDKPEDAETGNTSYCKGFRRNHKTT